MKKRFTSKIFFSAITKNSNWDILAKNLVTFKRQDGVKDENLFGEGWRGVHKKPILRGDCLKTGGAWTVC